MRSHFGRVWGLWVHDRIKEMGVRPRKLVEITNRTSVFLGGCILCSRLEAGELNRVDIRDFRIINKADEDVADIHRPERTFLVLKDREPGLKYG